MVNKLKEIRKSKGLSLQDLANIIGCDKAYIFRLENGQGINLEWAIKITKALDCFITDIFPELEDLIPPINKQIIEIDSDLLLDVVEALDNAIKTQNVKLTNKQKADTISELYQIGLYNKLHDRQKIDNNFVKWVIAKKI